MPLNKATLRKIKLTILFFLIFLVILYALTAIRERLDQLDFQVQYLLEDIFKTKVTIGKVEGDFVKELTLHDVTIYHEFRRDQKFAYAKKITLFFDLPNAILKEKVPVRNLKKVNIEDFEINVDENLSHLSFMRIMIGKDDGEDTAADDLVINFINGRAKSIFLKKNNGSFEIEDLNASISKIHTNVEVIGSGYFKGSQKTFYGTESAFHIKGNDSLKMGHLKGTLDFESVNYLGHHFKGVAFDFEFSPELVKGRVGPTRYEPYLEKLDEKYVKSFNSDKPFNYLIPVRLKYIIDEDDLYIDVPVDKESFAVQSIAKNYLQSGQFQKQLKYINPNFNWQVKGHAFFRFKQGNLDDFYIQVKEIKNIFQDGDTLSFTLKQYLSSDFKDLNRVLIEPVFYRGPNEDTISGKVIVNPDKTFETIDIKINNVNLPKLIQDHEIDWAFNSKNQVDLVNLETEKENKTLYESINLYKDNVSSHLKLRKMNNQYRFTISETHIGEVAFDTLNGKVLIEKYGLALELSGNENYDFFLKAGYDVRYPDIVHVDADLHYLNYPNFKKWYKTDFSIGDVYFKGKLKGFVDIKEMKKSRIRTQLLAYAIRKKAYQIEQNPYVLPGASGTNRQNQKAILQGYLKNNIFYLERFDFHDSGLKINGLLYTENEKIIPELSVTYMGFPFYIDGEIKKTGKNYYSEINVTTDQFTQKWSSLRGIFKLSSKGFEFKDLLLRHQRKNFRVNGQIAFKKQGVNAEVYLFNDYLKEISKKEIVSLKGDLSYYQNDRMTRYNPNLTIRLLKQAFKLSGSMEVYSDRIVPHLLLTYSEGLNQNFFQIGGLVFKKKTGMEGNLNLLINDDFKTLKFSVYETQMGSAFSMNLKGEESFFGFEGQFNKLDKNHFYTNFNFDINDRIINLKGDWLIDGGNLYTDIALKGIEHEAEIKGYITEKERFIFPHLNIKYKSAYTKDKTYQFNIEGKIEELEDYYKFETVINKGVNIKGQYKKYFDLNFRVLFDNYKLLLPDSTSLVLFNQYDEEGVQVKVNSTGIQSRGDLGIKELSSFPNSNFELETQFSYDIPFNQKDKSKRNQILFQKVKLTNNNKNILTSSGELYFKDNIWLLTLVDPEQNNSLRINYDSENQFINSRLRFNNFALNQIVSNLEGNLTGHLDLNGPIENPDLLSTGIRLENGKWNGKIIDASFSLKKDDYGVIIPNGYFSYDKKRIFLKGLSLTLPFRAKNIKSYLEGLIPKSKILLDSLTLKENDTTITLNKINYSVGDSPISFSSKQSQNNLNDKERDKEISIFNVLTNQNSRINFKNGTITSPQGLFTINDFNFVYGDNWRIDFTIKGKGIYLGNRYLGELNVFGGRLDNKKKAELNILLSHFQINERKFEDTELIFEAIGRKWKLWKNTLGLSAEWTIDNNILRYLVNYKENENKIESKGAFNFFTKDMDANLTVKHNDLSISRIAPIFLKKAGGSIDIDLKAKGLWFNPNLTGYIDIKAGYFLFKNKNYSFDNINLNILFNPRAVQLINGKFYQNSIYLITMYNEGLARLKGGFNLFNWEISDYDFALTTPRAVNLNINNDLLDYKGLVRTNLRLLKDKDDNVLSGKIYLKDAKISYVGKKQKIKKNQEEGIFDRISLNTVDILVEDDVSVNIGKGKLSIGEVLLKEGGYLLLLKDAKSNRDKSLRLYGELESKKGNFDYLGHNFNIVQSKVTLTQDQKTNIELVARTKVRDAENRLVTIYLKINDELEKLLKEQKDIYGDKRDLLFQSLSSTPSKSPEELALLLGVSGGETEKDLNELETGKSNVGRTADVAVNLTLVKPIERKLKELFGIDTFNIKTKFLQNTVFRESSTTEATEGTRVNPLRNTEITIGKYLTDDIYFSSGLLLIQDTHPARDNDTKKVWKFGLEADLFPLLNIQSETTSLQLNAEFQHRPDELYEGLRNEGIFRIEFNWEF